MGRSPCCEKVGLKKGPWTPVEDQKLLTYIEEHGHGSWRALPAKAGLRRCGKSCRLRWINYLRPDIKRGKFSLQEEQTIIQLHALLGNRWSAIAAHLPKRTDNEIKNHWNTHLKKRLAKMGIDPVTHKPKSSDSLGPEQIKDAANFSHMAQWESARLEAEARLVRFSSNLHVSNPFQTHLGNSFSPNHLLNNVTDFLPQPPPPPCLDVLTSWRGAHTSNIYSAAAAAASTLNFSQNPFPIPADGSIFVQNSLAGSEYINNFSACQAMAMKIEAEIAKLNNEKRLHDVDDYYNDGGESSLKTENGNGLLLPNFIEGLTDILLENNSNTNAFGCDYNVGGDVEENQTLWNSVLNNLVNCSPFGSPVF